MAIQTIKIPYSPRKWALELHNTVKRWIVLVLHRRAGKTTAVLNHLQRDCLRRQESQYAYIAPTYKQAKRIAWKIAKKISENIPGIKYNESDLTITYPNSSVLYLLGSDNPDSLRGMALWGVGFDEYPQQPSNIFSEIVSKALADHLGYAIFFGTPKGKNAFYDTYTRAVNHPNDWCVVFKTIDDSLKNEVGETINNLRQALEDDKRLVEQGEMTQEEFDQEWYCSFEAAIKGAYYAKAISKARSDGRIGIFPYDPELPVHTITDIGTGQALATGFYQKSAGRAKLVDYYEGGKGDGLPELIKAMKDKPYVYGKHYAPHDIRATEFGTGKTRIETAKKLGVEFEIIPSIPVDDGINAGQLFWAKLFVHIPTDQDPSRPHGCSVWLNAISQYKQKWDDVKGMFIEKPDHDWTSHAADVHRYAAIVFDEITNEEKKPRKQTERIEESRYEGTADAHTRKDDMEKWEEENIAKWG